MAAIHARVAAARQRLRAAGIAPEEADLDARLLAQSALGWTAERLLTSAEGAEPAGFAHRYEALVHRRAAREPLAYIVGHQEFWGLSFEVSPAVLIPRPETEILVETALEIFADSGAALRAADVCTGSGCLAAALARERPAARLVATDVSEAATHVARANARRLGVAGRIQFVCTNLLDALRESFDLIVSNPPYVPERDRVGLQPEVRDYEPAVALYSGADGLATIAQLVAGAPARLRAGGYLLFEFGYDQGEAVEIVVAKSPGLELVELRPDLQGIARAAVARRS